jgi:hypothetical protein
MKTRSVLVMKLEVQMDEDDNLYEAHLTVSDADDPRRIQTREFKSVGHALDKIFKDLLRSKMQQFAEQEAIHGQAGSA